MTNSNCKRVRKSAGASFLDEAMVAAIVFGVLVCLSVVSSGLNQGLKEIADHDPVAEYLLNVQTLVAGE